MREQTQWMLLLHPSDVPHLSRLQPPFGSASSQAILLHLKAPDQPEGIPSEWFSSWNRKRHWDTTLRYIINLTWENRKKSSCFRWPNGTRSFQQQCSLSFTCYFHDEEFQNLDIGTSWDFTLFSHSSLAAAQPEQRFWFIQYWQPEERFHCVNENREKLSQKNIYLVSVLFWPQYIRRGTFFVSRKGTFSNALLLLPGDMSVRLRDQWKVLWNQTNSFSPWVYSFVTGG